MSRLTEILRVRNLNNTRLQVPINNDFRDFWLQDLLDIEFDIVDADSPRYFSDNGLYQEGTCYRFQLVNEMPRIFQENLRSKQHPVLRSLKDLDSPIVDLTLGEGRDSLNFLKAGRKVLAFERNPFVLIYFLLNLARLIEVENLALKSLEIIFGSLNEYPRIRELRQFYYDPMYCPPRRKALPRGTIQLFEKLVTEGDRDQKENLTWMLDNYQGKFIVKRSPHAEPILENFHHQLKTKLVRYDVYIN